MATRSAKLYQGEDMLPVIDYTDDLIWEESEFGTRAWQGEGSASTVVIRDPLGEQGSPGNLPSGLTFKSLASKNLFVIDLDDEIMFRGRVGVKNYSRDGQQTERYRQVEVQLHDTHWDLDHIFVHNYARPSETDNARIQGVMASYLSGSPRPTTDLNGSNFLSGSNTVVLPAQTFKRTTPLGLIRDTALSGNKQFFTTGDTLGGGSMFYDGNDSTAYAAGIRISDRPDEVNTEGACSTAPILEASNGRIGDAGGESGLSLTVTSAEQDRAIYVMVRNTAGGAISVRWSPDVANPGARQEFSLVDELPIGGDAIQVWRLLNPDPTVGDSKVEVVDTVSQEKFWSYFYFSGVNQSNPNGTVAFSTGTGTASSLAISEESGDVSINMAGWFTDNQTGMAAPTPGGGQTQSFAGSVDRPFGQPDGEAGAGYGSAAPTWTFSSSQTWHAAGVAVKGGAALTFPPIWNVGPASTEDGSEQLCEVVLFYGSGGEQYVTAHDLVVHTQYGHSSETFTDDTIPNSTEAQRRANSILAHRKDEDKTYNVTIGPLTDEQVLCVKHGQTIDIKARAIPDADDQFRTMRIVQCRYTTPVIGTWFAHLQLGRPWKMAPYGTGSPLSAGSGAASDSTPEPIGVEGSPGSDDGEVAAADHVHAHGTIANIPAGTAHPAADVSIADAGGHFIGTDVEAALQELADSPGGASALDDLTDVTIATPGDGQVLTYDSGSGEWVNENSASGFANPMTTAGDIITGGSGGAAARLPLGSALQHLRVNAGATALEYADPPAGGGGGAKGKYQNASGLSGIIDTFDDGSISGSWTLVRDEARMNWSEKYGNLNAVRNNSVAGAGTRDLEAYLQSATISVGDYAEAALSWNRGPNSTGIFGAGIIMSDGATFGAGNQVVVWQYTADLNEFWTQAESFTNFSTGGTRGTQFEIRRLEDVRYLRLKYEAANTWGAYWSLNGLAWMPIQTNFSKTMTPTHVGVVVVHWDNPNPVQASVVWHYIGLNVPD